MSIYGIDRDKNGHPVHAKDMFGGGEVPEEEEALVIAAIVAAEAAEARDNLTAKSSHSGSRS